MTREEAPSDNLLSCALDASLSPPRFIQETLSAIRRDTLSANRDAGTTSASASTAQTLQIFDGVNNRPRSRSGSPAKTPT
ncbi:unnamed protein product, partial [Amoebophrya sp. A25]|eukprot:GSA25T00015734001.1